MCDEVTGNVPNMKEQIREVDEKEKENTKEKRQRI